MPGTIEQMKAGFSFFDVENGHSRVFREGVSCAFVVPPQDDAENGPICSAVPYNQDCVVRMLFQEFRKEWGKALFQVGCAFPPSWSEIKLICQSCFVLIREFFIYFFYGVGFP